jgi:hypothetical protein
MNREPSTAVSDVRVRVEMELESITTLPDTTRSAGQFNETSSRFS